MKIGHIESPPIITTAADRKTAPAAGNAGPEASAQVALSSAATVIADTTSDPTFDAAKVERIAQAIRDGKFSINAEAIADKLIINAEELLGRKLSN